MITEQAMDIVNKLNLIPSLSKKVGLALGGKNIDPATSKVPLPAAWVVYQGARAVDPLSAVAPRLQSMQSSFSVLVYIAYKDQDDLAKSEYPLLDEVAKSIRGTDAPTFQRWRLEAINLILVNPDRLGYEFVFSTIAMI